MIKEKTPIEKHLYLKLLIFVPKKKFLKVHILFLSKYDNETGENANQSLLANFYFPSIEICLYFDLFQFCKSSPIDC